MEPQKQILSLAQLNWRLLHRTYGFVDGEWYYIHKNKPLFSIVIELTDGDPEISKRYQEWLDTLFNPLDENF
jgi:hypothetical protein